MSLSAEKVHIHGRLRGLTKRRVAQLAAQAEAKMARPPASATVVVLGHGSATSTLEDDGTLDLGFSPVPEVRLESENRFKARLGIPAGANVSEDVARTLPASQLEKNGGLTSRQLRALELYDVVDPLDGLYSYRDLVAA